MDLPKNLGMYLLAIWFILAGLGNYIAFGPFGMLMPVMMIVIGALLLVELMWPRSTRSTDAADVLESNWSQLRGPIMTWWSELTDRDIDEINGNYGRLVRKLRASYDLSDQSARREIDAHLADYQRRERPVAHA